MLPEEYKWEKIDGIYLSPKWLPEFKVENKLNLTIDIERPIDAFQIFRIKCWKI